jgi:serine protease AprX
MANGMSQSDPQKKPFTPEVLDKTVIAIPLLEQLETEAKALAQDSSHPPKPHPIIIDLNLEYEGGRAAARIKVEDLVQALLQEFGIDPKRQGINKAKSEFSQQYLFGVLEGRVIRELVRRDNARQPAVTTEVLGVFVAHRAIYRIWPDFPVKGLITKSVSTVKADAARNSFAALGENIVWAVMDSGIDARHPHFAKHENLKLSAPLVHRDFIALSGNEEPLIDVFGHGTHVAGIIAGEMTTSPTTLITATVKYRDERGEVIPETLHLPAISGMAPKCKLLSLKVLDDNGDGLASNLIAAIEQIQEINGNGRRIRVHGVNMSVGYDFEPEWFACGQSPLCVEVDRLVRSGVVVVVAAGNTGYGWAQSAFRGTIAAGMDLTINDPGNAELAITVGSTHREMPHIYGVSYFSSKGPTGDGRLKPDLVAPGEKIISCASGGRPIEPLQAEAVAPTTVDGPAGEVSPVAVPEETARPAAAAPTAVGPEVAVASAATLSAVVVLEETALTSSATAAAPASDTVHPEMPATSPPEAPQVEVPTMHGQYREDSGTSMAAPHVSGVIAAFLSVRREYIGQPEAVKQIFLSTATDLRRTPYFQGRGLVDLMRAIQSV